MLKFILLIAAVSLTSARVWDTKFLTNGLTDQDLLFTQYEGFDTIDSDPLKRMSSDELLKQRFLVKILDHVQQPLMDRDICQVADTFVRDQNRYKKGIDGDMIYVIELCRNFGNVKKDELFNMANKDHLRQMIGLQRILARSKDFETFNQNVCCARKQMNEVLFVNALLQAIRQREDTQRLVIPGLHEILPEFYLDRDIIRTVQNVGLNQLRGGYERDTTRRSFLDLVGLGGQKNWFDTIGNRNDDFGRSNLRIPGREWRMEIAMRKTPYNKDLITSDIEDKIVIAVNRRFDVTRDLTLLTNDVGLKGFIQLTVNDLCLRENQLEKNRFDNFDDIDRNGRGFGRIERGDDLQTQNDYRYRLQDLIRGNRGLNNRQYLNDYASNDGLQFWTNYGNQLDTARGLNNFRFNTRRSQLENNNYYDNDRYSTALRGSQIYDGRHNLNDQRRMVFGEYNDLNDLGTTLSRKLNDYDYLNKRVGLNSRRNQIIDDIRHNSKFDDDYNIGLNDDYDSREWQTRYNNKRYGGNLNDERFNDLENTLQSVEDNEQKFVKTVPRSDVLLHNLKQIMARIENEKLCLGLENNILSDNRFNDVIVGQNHLLDETQNGLLGGNDIREIKATIQDIFNNIQVNIGIDRVNPLTFDQLIANALLKNDGRLNILDIFRDVVGNVHQDQRSSINMGVNLNNPVVQKILKALTDEVELQRTKVLGSYSRRDLNLDGVRVNDVAVDQLKTFTDLCDVDVRNLLDKRNVGSNDEQKTIVAKVQRLNHKEFTIKIDLDSDQNRKVMIRTFLGPKLSNQIGRELEFDETRQKFMLIDSHIVNLQSGKNIIKRRSRDIKWTARDTTPLTEIYKRVMVSLNNRMNVDNITSTKKVVGQDCRFPHRLIIPRGRVDGIQMQMLVVVTGLENGIVVRDDLACAMGVGCKISDGRSFGFPLDRRVDNVEDLISMPNVQIKDVVVRHDERIQNEY